MKQFIVYYKQQGSAKLYSLILSYDQCGLVADPPDSRVHIERRAVKIRLFFCISLDYNKGGIMNEY